MSIETRYKIRQTIIDHQQPGKVTVNNNVLQEFYLDSASTIPLPNSDKRVWVGFDDVKPQARAEGRGVNTWNEPDIEKEVIAELKKEKYSDFSNVSTMVVPVLEEE